MDTMGKWWLIAKNLVKSSLDHYVLPGTLTGTEILLVYLHQWKRDIFLIAAAAFYQRLNQPSDNELDEALVRAPERGCDATEGSA